LRLTQANCLDINQSDRTARSSANYWPGSTNGRQCSDRIVTEAELGHPPQRYSPDRVFCGIVTYADSGWTAIFIQMTMRLAKFVKFREEKFGGVLFETRSEKVFTLNPTAAAVISEIQAGYDEPQILTRLKERFGGSEGAIEREAVSFIADLRNKGLLED